MNSKTLDVSFSQGTDEWETPQHLFNDLDAEFHFDLDPCASPATAKTLLWYGEEEDGLLQDWQGHRVFCNPPYSDVKSWVRKAYEEGHKPNTLVVMLLFARTDTKWFHDYVLNRAEVRFMRGRIKFGGAVNNAPFPSMIVIFRGPGM